MANKFKQQYDVKNIFFNHMKGKLGEEVVKIRLGDFVTEIDYEKRIGGDGKIDFTLTSDPSVGIQVKTRYGYFDKVQWTIDREEIERNAVLVCILCQEEFSDTEKEYGLIIAGFLPTNMIKSTGDKTLVGIDELLYPGGLCGYLESLSFYDADKYINLGDECLDKKDYEGAVFHYNQALLIKPNDAVIYKNRGQARYFLGDNQGAIEDVKQAADLSYRQGDQKFYKYALDRIRELELQEDNKSHKQLQQLWNVGDHVMHKTFGTGQITHVFGSGNRVSLAIRFNELGQKILDPTIAQLVKID
ncbi:tetratricopeptide repeat protein [Dolichospermum sp. UHCC 0259]|uniref:tetratricopeptide repeat protein n=1 Tax=Dolichospermum sp. UHCC 0259 TaxID=2590010 RepID=UPI00352A3753